MEKPVHLKYNDPAPDLALENTNGERIQLASLWQTKPLLLAFTRHFGCLQCKEMLYELAQAQSEIERAGLTLVAITQGTAAETREFATRFAPNITCLADPTRRAYNAYGLERGTLRQTILSAQVLNGTRRAQKRGFRAEMPPAGQDIRQMSGTFIIGTDGHIRLPYYYDTIADHPSIELLLRGVLATNWNEPFDGAIGSRVKKSDL